MTNSLRKKVLKLNRGTIASALSCVELLQGIFKVMKRSDRFILSKGHAAIPYFLLLAKKGYSKAMDIPKLPDHPDTSIPGVYAVSGSLGNGLGLACGASFFGRRIFVLLGDAEMQEGSNWESIMFAGDRGLKIVGVIDCNGIGATGFIKKPTPQMFRSFGWECEEINNGHSRREIEKKLKSIKKYPVMFLAHTIKGKGVKEIEGQPDCHLWKAWRTI